MSEIIFYAVPGVFGDEGLDHAPWLLLVFHIGIDPGSTAHILDGSRLKARDAGLIKHYLT